MSRERGRKGRAWGGAAAVVWLGVAASAGAQTAPDAGALTALLREFLAGASRNDAAMHERFWAPDLIYTSSAGRRMGKAEVLAGVRSAPPSGAGQPATTYGAEDVRVQQYGDTAIVAFRLVGETTKDGKTEVATYLNSGTFLRRDGRWQAVSWQATRVPPAGQKP